MSGQLEVRATTGTLWPMVGLPARETLPLRAGSRDLQHSLKRVIFRVTERVGGGGKILETLEWIIIMGGLGTCHTEWSVCQYKLDIVQRSG
jgi:hypothetical protein